MTYQNEQHTGETAPRETLAKPPPPVAGDRETPLFQTMDELHVRHGDSPGIKARVYLWGGALLIGSIVFGVLYLVILLLE